MPVGFTPIYRITKDGENITGHFNDRTIMIRVDSSAEQGEGGDLFHIIVDDRDWMVARPEPGAILAIELGYKEVGLAYMGTFEIDEVVFEWVPKQITLIGTSQGMLNTMKSQAVREFDNKTVGEIVQEIAKKAGITAEVHPSLAQKKVPYKNQFASNFHLLNDLERRFDGLAKFANGKLQFVPMDGGQTASVQGIASPVFLPEHFGKGRIKYTEKTEYSRIAAAWRDKETYDMKWENIPNPGYTPGETGAQDLPARVKGIFNSQGEAQEAAQSTLNALRRAGVEGYLELARGDPWIRAGAHATIQGMRDGIDGEYLITRATHVYTKDSGLQTTLEVSGTTHETGLISNIEPIESIAIPRDRIDPSTGRVLGGV